MKSKSPLMLMEQLIMVLVFALAAAFCLQAFVLADRVSHDCEKRDAAVCAAQSAADTLKGCAGDYAAAAKILGGEWDGECWSVAVEKTDGESVGLLTVTPQKSENTLLGRAQVEVIAQDGEPLFSLPVAWQEVAQ